MVRNFSTFLNHFTKGIEPITVVTHHDTLHTEEDRQTALKQASEATGSSIGRTLFIWNYTNENRTRNPEIERMALEILHSAVKEAEKAVVKIIAKTGLFLDWLIDRLINYLVD